MATISHIKLPDGTVHDIGGGGGGFSITELVNMQVTSTGSKSFTKPEYSDYDLILFCAVNGGSNDTSTRIINPVDLRNFNMIQMPSYDNTYAISQMVTIYAGNVLNEISVKNVSTAYQINCTLTIYGIKF